MSNGTPSDSLLKVSSISCFFRAQRSIHEIRTASQVMEQEDYFNLLKELDHAKQELSRLKLDMSTALVAKKQAERDLQASKSKERMCSGFILGIKKEIENVDEEQVLVELARIETERETREIETKRASEAAQFAMTVNETRIKIRHLRNRINQYKDFEKELAITTSDVNALQTEMEFLRAMEKKFQKDQLKKKEEELQVSSLLRAAEVELESGKTELASLNREGFQFMASMDLARRELIQIAEESNHLKKLEKDADIALQYLNSKLLNTKARLKSALAADERAKAIISNLSTALQTLQTDIDEANKGMEVLHEEIKAKTKESYDVNLGIDSAQKRLRAALKELEAVKAAEAMALSTLKIVSDGQMRDRLTHSSLRGSTITISIFEYEYLRQRAEAAQVVADKKVAAAQAWKEAIAAREREISLEAEIARRATTEVRAADDSRKAKPRSLKGEIGVAGESRRVKIRRSSISLGRRRSITGSPSFHVKRKKKVMTNLVRLLRGRRIGNVN